MHHTLGLSSLSSSSSSSSASSHKRGEYMTLQSYSPRLLTGADAHDTALVDDSPTTPESPIDHRIAIAAQPAAVSPFAIASSSSSSPSALLPPSAFAVTSTSSSSSTSSALIPSAHASSGLVDDYDVPTCRICFESDGELIVPCLCSGSSLHIHRQCLDDWRAINMGKKAFRQCSTCHFPYQYEPPQPSDTQQHAENTVRYRLLVVRDVLLVLLTLQLVVALIAYLLFLVDRACGGNIPRVLPSLSLYVVFFLFSLLLCLALLGLFGLIAKTCGWEDTLLRRHPMHQHGDGCCDGCCNACGGLDCCRYGGGGGGWGGMRGGGGGDEGLLVLFIVVMLVLAVFGIFYGLLYGSVLLERLTSRHVKRRWYRSEVEKYRVVDWTANPQQLRAWSRKAY